jgi:DNA-binding transcriptional LysR family regulator
VLLAGRGAALDPSVTWEQAARLPLCLLTTKMRNRQIIDAAFRRVGAKPDVILQTDSVFSLYAHVSEAGLYSIVPHSLLKFFDLANRVQARPLLPPLTRSLAPVTGAVWGIARSLNLQDRFDLTLE